MRFDFLRNLTFAALMVFGVSTAQADVVLFNIDNNDGLDSVALNDMTGLGGSVTSSIGATGLSTTLTVTNITSYDTDDAATAVLTSGTGTGHQTNIASNSFGINGAGSGGFNSDATNFAPGESFTFTFDQNIQFTSIDLQSFDSAAEQNGLRISSAGFADFEITNANLPTDANGDPEDATGFDFVFPTGLVVAAGEDVTFEAFSANGTFNIANTFRIQDFSVEIVAVPEPSSLAILGLLGSLVAIRRRR